jgi:putative acetyltransferase
MEGITLRDGLGTDSDAVRKLVFDVLAEYGLAVDPAGTDSDLLDLEASYLEPGGVFKVLVGPAGAIVGCGGLLPLDARECELRKMYLLPAARGRGLGRALLHELLACARSRGFARVSLETNTVLREAIALYRSQGFRPAPPPSHCATRCDQAWALEL